MCVCDLSCIISAWDWCFFGFFLGLVSNFCYDIIKPYFLILPDISLSIFNVVIWSF